MTKRLKHDGKCQSRPTTQVKTFHNHPLKFANPLFPLNNKEQKERFLTHGEISKFQLKGTDEEIAGLFKKAHSRIRFDLLGEAEHILNKVKEEYSASKDFVENQFGPKISKEEATSRLMAYLKENRLDGCLNIIWCADMASSGSMQRVGPQPSVNKPEAQRYSMWIKNDQHNPFVRETGIQCLANHEIGTHFIRSFNDGLQPWYTDRERFGIRSTQTLEFIRTEEGLASLNTVLNARSKYLWGPALLYYTACKAAEMTFKQLFEHLTIYIDSPGQRWNYCMRVKRGLPDPNDIGGYGKDQCYFEGAVDILRNVDKIDFTILMSGKVCVDEILRIKRIARIDCIRLPAFMKKEERYKKYLRQIAAVNELHLIHPTRRPPSVYMHRVQMGYFLGKAQPNTQKSSRKVRKKNRQKGKATTVVPKAKNFKLVTDKNSPIRTCNQSGYTLNSKSDPNVTDNILNKQNRKVDFEKTRKGGKIQSKSDCSVSRLDKELVDSCLGHDETDPFRPCYIKADELVNPSDSLQPTVSAHTQNYYKLIDKNNSGPIYNDNELEYKSSNIYAYSPRFAGGDLLQGTLSTSRSDLNSYNFGTAEKVNNTFPHRPFRLSRLNPLVNHSAFLTKLEVEVSKFTSDDPHIPLSPNQPKVLFSRREDFAKQKASFWCEPQGGKSENIASMFTDDKIHSSSDNIFDKESELGSDFDESVLVNTMKKTQITARLGLVMDPAVGIPLTCSTKSQEMTEARNEMVVRQTTPQIEGQMPDDTHQSQVHKSDIMNNNDIHHVEPNQDEKPVFHMWKPAESHVTDNSIICHSVTHTCHRLQPIKGSPTHEHISSALDSCAQHMLRLQSCSVSSLVQDFNKLSVQNNDCSLNDSINKTELNSLIQKKLKCSRICPDCFTNAENRLDTTNMNRPDQLGIVHQESH